MKVQVIVTIKDYNGKTKGNVIFHDLQEAYEFMNKEDKKFNTETEFEVFYY